MIHNLLVPFDDGFPSGDPPCTLNSIATPSITGPDHPAAHSALLRRVGWRILPLLILLYFIAFLDRINVGFAAASMQRDLGFSDTLYGTGAGLFFLGALIAQIPSTLLLSRFGARRTLSVIMLAWSCTSGAMAFIHSPTAFLTLRFLLGVAEAGFYPGVIVYLTLWTPRRVRSSFTAWFLFAIPLASIFGGPVSSLILTRTAHTRLAGWQWLFLLEALPALLLGTLLPLLMTDHPASARWLSPADRDLLARIQQADESEPNAAPAAETTAPRQSAPSPLAHVLLFATIYFAMQLALYAQSFWLPRILHDAGIATAAVGWHIAIVYAVAAVGMLAWGRIADTAPNGRWTLAVPLLAAVAAYVAISATAHVAATHIGLLLALFGVAAAACLAATPPFWSQVTLRQHPRTLAAIIPTVNALGNLGGFAGPTLFGRLQHGTGSFAAGMLAAAAGLLVAALLLALRRSPRLAPDHANL